MKKKPVCKICGGSGEVWDIQEFGGRDVGDKVPCPNCKSEPKKNELFGKIYMGKQAQKEQK